MKIEDVCFALMKMHKQGKKKSEGVCSCLASLSLSLSFVELAGVEPASKHGSHMLSTCLVLLDFRDRPAAEQPNLSLDPLFSPSGRNLLPTSP